MEPRTAVEATQAAAARLACKMDNLGRKIWDKNFFSLKAQQRQYENGADPGIDFLTNTEHGPRKGKQVPPPLERRALEARKAPVTLDEDLGKMKVITSATPKQYQGGYWCDVCECLIKDSQAYLDHLNGKKHNRLLGMSMTVERVGTDEVVQRLKQLKVFKQKQKEAEMNGEKDDLYKSITARLEESKKSSHRKKRSGNSKQDTNRDSKRILTDLFPDCNITEDALYDLPNVDDIENASRRHPTRFDVPPIPRVTDITTVEPRPNAS